MINRSNFLKILFVFLLLVSGCVSPATMQFSEYKNGKRTNICYSPLYVAKNKIIDGHIEIVSLAYSLKKVGLGYVIAKFFGALGPDDWDSEADFSLIFTNTTLESVRLEFGETTYIMNKYKDFFPSPQNIALKPLEVRVVKKFTVFKIPTYSTEFLLKMIINSKPYVLNFKRLTLGEFKKQDLSFRIYSQDRF